MTDREEYQTGSFEGQTVDRAAARVYERSRGSKLPVGLTVCLAAAAAWYWFSPIFAMKDFRDAVVSADAVDVAEMVDFPALREQLRSELISQATIGRDRPAEALADLAFVDISLGILSNPAGLIRFLGGAGVFRGNQRFDLARTNDWTIERSGFTSFKAEVRTGSLAGPQLVFRRYGLGWRLAGIYGPRQAEPAGVIELPGAEVQGLNSETMDEVRAAEQRAAALASMAEAEPSAQSDYTEEMPDAATDAAAAASEAASAAAAIAADAAANNL